jgi:tetratricopeptide (TPR) repeat protein
VIEKAPLLLLAAAASVITLVAQHGASAVSRLGTLPLHLRAANACLSYVAYLFKMVWPERLAVLYPHPLDAVSLGTALVAGLLLIGVTVAAFRTAKRRPYFLVGWLWYLGTLVPVIGLVQVGAQSMADRYTYLPCIGLFLATVWGCAELARGRRFGPALMSSGGVLVLLAFALISFGQVRYWKDSTTLFEHTLRVTSNNYIIHASLADHLARRGELQAATAHYTEAVGIHPSYARAHYNLGAVLAMQGERDRAIRHYAQALKIPPSDVEKLPGLRRLLDDGLRAAQEVQR